MYQPLLKHFEKTLDVKTRFIVTQDYDGLTEALKRQSVDIAAYSPKAYVTATKKIPDLQYLVTSMTIDDNGKLADHYKGLIITRKDLNIKNISELKGKRFAFTNKESSSGFAYPESRLRKQNIDYKTFFSKVFFLKKHERIMGALAKSSVDAGATWDGAYDEGVKKYGDQFTILDSVPIPNDPLCAAPHVSKTLAHKIQEILLGLKPDSAVMKAMGANGFPDVGFSKRNDQFYNVVRDLAK